MKTLQNHFVRSALFLLFALLCPILVQAQGTPWLNPSEFIVNVANGNTTCGIPGSVVISYHPNVAGFKTLHYAFSNDGITWDITQDAAPSDVVTQTLADWEDEDPLFINVYGVTADGSKSYTISLGRIQSNGQMEQGFDYALAPISSADIKTTIDGAGDCNSQKGRITMALNQIGFASVDWKLYQGTTLLKTIHSTTPNTPVLVDQLAAGTYRIEARATPACTTTHPAPTTPDASWDGDVLVLTRTVEVDNVRMQWENKRVAMGNCGSYYESSIFPLYQYQPYTYELFARGGGGSALQSKRSGNQDFGRIRFEDIPPGDYTIRVTFDCGTVYSKDITIEGQEPQVYASYDNSAAQISPCAKGVITCSTNTQRPEEPQTYRLIRVSDNSVLATKTWKSTPEEPQCRIENLSLDQNEEYLVEADFCGITAKSDKFKPYIYVLNINWQVVEAAKGICTGEGAKVKVKITKVGNNAPVTSAGTFEVIDPKGTTIVSQAMPEGWNGEITLNDVPGLYGSSYKVRFTLDCNGLVTESSGSAYLGSHYISMSPEAKIEQCIPKYAIRFKPYGPNGKGMQSLIEGTYEVRKKDGTLIWQGNYVPDWDLSGDMQITVPDVGEYVVTGRNSCGSFIVSGNATVVKPDIFPYISANVQKIPLPCYDNGAVSIALGMDKGTAVNEVFWELEKDGSPYRSGQYDGYDTYVQFYDLPVGKYKFSAHVQCDPTIKKEVTFELQSELKPASFTTDGSCGSKILGMTNISLPQFNADYNNKVASYGLSNHYKLYNADTGILYQEGDDFSLRLPSGNYRMEITPKSLICGGITPYIFNFTVPPVKDSFVLRGGTNNKPVQVVNAAYRSNTGSITGGVYQAGYDYNKYTLASDNFPIQLKLRSKDGSYNKTLTVAGIGKNVTFENLAPGTYVLSADIDGNSCIPDQTIKVENNADDAWNASAHLSPSCGREPERKRHVSFRIAGTWSGLATAVYTFKTFVWDDVADDYVLSHSVVGTPGQLTAMVPISEYTGTTAPLCPNYYSYQTPPKAPYKYVIEEGGEVVYTTLDVLDDPSHNQYYHNPQVQTEVTQPTKDTPKGKATLSVAKFAMNYQTTPNVPIFPYGMSLRDKIVWVLRPSGGDPNNQTIIGTKTTDMFTSVTFDNLAPGAYYVEGRLTYRGCRSMGYGGLGSGFVIMTPPTPPPPTDPLKDGLKLEAVGVNGVCDSDCKIKVKLQNEPTLITKVTYTISYAEDDDEKTKVISTANSAEEVVFDGLPAGDYTIKAVAEAPTPDGLKLYRTEKNLKLVTASPDMNIIQHTEATRPSFKNCATGYLAFRFQDGGEWYHPEDGIPRPFNEDYEFIITEAPAGVTVPRSFKPVHLYSNVNSCNYNYWGGMVAITPFRDLPKGEYKVKVVNHCKTLFLTCQIGEMEAPYGSVDNGCLDLDVFRNPKYSECLNLPNISTKDNKYYISYSPWRFTIGNRLFLWDDLITQDIHDRFGNEMKNVPYTGDSKELTVRIWAIDKITFKYKCPSIADQVFTGFSSVCEHSTEYCGAPIVDVTDIIQRASILPETFTLVVNEMNGTVIGNEVLRKVNPTQPYSLGTVKKRFLARLYTADGILLYQLYLNPVGVDNSLTVHASVYNIYTCTRPILDVDMVKPVFPCYVPYVIKMYSGDGTHTLLREFLISTSGGVRIYDLMPDTDYEFELYASDGTLLDSKTAHTPKLPTWKLPNTYYFGNACNGRNTVVKSFMQNGKQMNKMFYQLKVLFATGFDSNTNNYYPGRQIFSVVRNGVTYKQYWSGPKLYTEDFLSDTWYVVRNGLEYKTEAPIFDWGETINGTLSVPECGLSVNITGKAEKYESNFKDPQLENMSLVQTCTGWNVTPGGKISYVGLDGNRQTLTYKEYQDPYNGQWKAVNVPFAQPKSPNRFGITLRGDNLCDLYVEKRNLVYIPHAINKIESASYYCSGNNKGRIYVGAQDGVPPYKYELLNGENETDPVVETKTDTGPVVFEYGNVGQKYRVHVWDACGNLRIHYLTTVVSTVDLGYELSKTRQLCAGDNLRLTMQSFPGATYDWTLPDGTHRNTRNLDLGPATRAMAGAYNVVITPSDCNSTINATITVVVDDIGAPSWTPAMQTICQGTTTTLSPGAAQSYTDNTPGTPKYQWQRRDPYGSSFSDIDGATMADYNFQADTPSTYTFRRVTTYKGCEHTSDEAKVVVTPGPIQTLSPAELERTVRKGSTGYTLTGGSLQTNGTTIASYKWERSTDGSTWTTVGTTANYKETQKFKLEKVYYRRTVTPTVGTCVHTTPTITVNFKKMRAAYVNPHIRTRVKSE